MPIFLDDDGRVTEKDGALESGDRAIESLQALAMLRGKLDQFQASKSSSL
jgi:hypothetical protein